MAARSIVGTQIGRNIVARKLEKVKHGFFFSSIENPSYFGPFLLTTFKMVGRKESVAPMWVKENRSGWFPTVNQVYLGCTQRAATIDDDTIQATAGLNVENVSSWSYDMKGYAEQCFERYCELASESVSQLTQTATL